MKNILILICCFVSFNSVASVTNNTIGCNSAELYETYINAVLNKDSRMIEHLSSTLQCYRFNDGLEYSEIGSAGFFDTIKKIRVWKGDQYIDAYVDKFEGIVNE